MARSNKFELDFEGMNEALKDLKALGGSVKKTTELALKESHTYITPLIEQKLDKSKMPRGGKYSTEDREHSLKQLIRDPNITWEGNSCSVDIGFNLDETLVPIYLIRGTQTMKPVNGLRTVLEGKKTKEAVAELQHDVIVDEILKHYGY